MKPLPTRPEIFYHPPKSSSFGHATTPRNPTLGWRRTLAFLDEVTECTLRPDIELRIRCHPQWSDPTLIAECIGAATAQFGEPSQSDGDLNKVWVLGADSLEAAVEFALLDTKRPRQELGPTWLHFSYGFSWKPHASLLSAPRPGEGSYLGVFHGSRRLFVQPTFRFPFEAPTPEFKAFLAHVQAHLPFAFKEAHFKSLLPSASGKLPIVRKLRGGWLGA
jgi:hypothetical protein